MTDMTAPSVLYTVAECPVGCGTSGVVALSVPGAGLIYYSPCCGVAWPRVPTAVDSIHALADLVPTRSVRLPAREEILAAGHTIIREERYDEWEADLDADLARPALPVRRQAGE